MKTWVLIVIFNSVYSPKAEKDAPMAVPGFASEAKCEEGAARARHAATLLGKTVDTLCWERTTTTDGGTP